MQPPQILLALFLPLSLTFHGAAAQEPSPAPLTWHVVCDDGAKVQAVRLHDDLLIAVPDSLLAPPLPLSLTIGKLDHATVPGQALVSPDGSRVAHVLRTWHRAAAHGEIAIANADGSGARLLTANGMDNRLLAWLPDGHRLLYRLEKPAADRRPRQRQIVIHDLRTDELVPFADQDLSPSVRPVLLVDGHLLYTRVRRSGPPEAPTAALDLVVANPERPDQSTVVLADAGDLLQLEPTPNGLFFWLVTGDSVRRVDRLQRKVAEQWTLPQLTKPGWQVRIGQACVRPDGD